MIFFNRCFDKNRIKNLIYWSLMNRGEKYTIELVEKLKELGFFYATQAGISLGIDDLRIPPAKFLLISQSEKEILASQHEYQRGNLTAVEKFQQMIDTWHKTSEILRSAVVQHFKLTDLLNPVYMMAFSGARGSISQVRQLVGMRGLMADPQGQIIEFPIRSNFREGLTLTEYIISCYGARKGLVDTALRTANSGYLTRRLVDVGQHVLVSQLDCGTEKGIFLMDMKEGNKIILPLQTRLLGRILAEDISLKPSDILFKNTDISSSLAAKITKIKNKVLVRSPLMCEAKNSICQLCYGWSLAHGNMVSLGEAVGILAAQSIGEPGTQLTMRTFHTGGVFSGDVMEEIRAPFSGKISYKEPLQGTLIRTPHGKIAFLTKIEGEFFLRSESLNLLHRYKKYNVKQSYDFPSNNIPMETLNSSNKEQKSTIPVALLPNDMTQTITPQFEKKEKFLLKKFTIPTATVLFVREGEKVFKNQIIAEISSLATHTNQRIQSTHHLNSDLEGEIYFEDVLLGVKIGKEGDIVQSARKLGSLWILSGKIYQSIVPLTFFPKILDLVTKNSIMNQSVLKIPYIGRVGKIKKISSPLELKNSYTKNKQMQENKFFFKQALLNLPIKKIKFKKLGYFFSLFSTFSNDQFFLYNSKSARSFANPRNNQVKFQQSNLCLEQLNSKFLSQFSWFPKKYKTKTSGLVFMDQSFFNDDLTFGQIFWVPEHQYKIKIFPQSIFAIINFIENFSSKKLQKLNKSKTILGKFYNFFLRSWVTKPESLFYKLNLQEKRCFPIYSNLDGVLNIKSVNKSNSLFSKHLHKAYRLTSSRSAFHVKKQKFNFYKNPLNFAGLLEKSLKNKKFTHIEAPLLDQYKKNQFESRSFNVSFLEELYAGSNIFCNFNKVNKTSIDINFTLKPGWVYYPKNQKKALFFHKSFIPPGKLIVDTVIFDQCMVYIECIPIYSKNFKKSKFFIKLTKSLKRQKIGKRSFYKSNLKQSFPISKLSNSKQFPITKEIIITGTQSFKGVFCQKLEALLPISLSNSLDYFQKFSNLIIGGKVASHKLRKFSNLNSVKQSFPMFKKSKFKLSFDSTKNNKIDKKTETYGVYQFQLKKSGTLFSNLEKRFKAGFKTRGKKENVESPQKQRSFPSNIFNHQHINNSLFIQKNLQRERIIVSNQLKLSFPVNSDLKSQKFFIIVRKIREFSLVKNGNLKNKLLKLNKKNFLLFSKKSIHFNKQNVSKLLASFPGIDIKIKSFCCFQNIKLKYCLTKTNIFDILVSFSIPSKFPFKNPYLNLLFSQKIYSQSSRAIVLLPKNFLNGTFDLGLFFEFSLIRQIELNNFGDIDLQTKKTYSTSLLIYDKNLISNQHSFTISSFFSPYSGEILSKQIDFLNKQSCLILTPLDQITFLIREKKSLTYIGNLIRFGDELAESVATPLSGQVIQIDKENIILRRAQPILFSSRGVFHVQHKDFVEKNTPLLTLFYQRLKTGDIVQGIPKIEEFFEARQTKEGEILAENLHTQLQEIFQQFKQKFNSQQAARKSVEKIQQILVEGVQRVYQSQGVTISDKHIEIIVRQMTSKVKIIEGGQTGLLRGELIDLEWIELVNKGIETQKAEYEPLILGITKASLETESFISAASFQETTRILSRAAIERKTDFLRGLKENVILGHLIPAGTGFSLSFDPESSKFIRKNNYKNYNYFFNS